MSIFAPVIDSAKIIFLNSSIWHGHSFLVFHVRSTCSITSQMIRALTNADAEVYSKIEYAILTEYQRIEIKHIWQAA